MNRTCVLVAVCLLCGSSAAYSQASPGASAGRDKAQLAATGTNLRLHLPGGDFRIVGGDSDQISFHVDGKNRAQAKRMQIVLKRSSDGMDLTLSHVPKKEAQVTITVPRESNLFARMSGGDLSVEGVTGDKDIELVAGDLSIQVGDPEEYAHVDVSVKFGDVSGDQFGEPKGVMGNSMRREGSGKYRLHAHVMAGDLMLKS
jgi:hypothetical protein